MVSDGLDVAGTGPPPAGISQLAVAAGLDAAATRIEQFGPFGPVGYRHDYHRVGRGWS